MLHQNIKNLRKQNGYTQETFAQELNVVRQTVSKWEKGYSVPDAVMLEKIAELFDVSAGDLLGDATQVQAEKPDLRQISEQLSILNNQFARELARKQKNRRIALGVLLAVFLLIPAAILLSLLPLRMHGESYMLDPSTNQLVFNHLDDALDDALSEAILTNGATGYGYSECMTESHYVYDTREDDDIVTVYVHETHEGFSFVNGFFTNVSGGWVPAVYKFLKEGDAYKLVSREQAKDGADYTPSIKVLFPGRLSKEVLRALPDGAADALWDDCVRQAKAYLASIGRVAVVCRYREIQRTLLSDCGVPLAVAENLPLTREGYDYMIGNHEKVEHGKRYVYQTEYDKAHQWITFTKFRYDTNEVIAFTAYDAATGDVVKNAPAPEKAVYYFGALADE